MRFLRWVNHWSVYVVLAIGGIGVYGALSKDPAPYPHSAPSAEQVFVAVIAFLLLAMFARCLVSLLKFMWFVFSPVVTPAATDFKELVRQYREAERKEHQSR